MSTAEAGPGRRGGPLFGAKVLAARALGATSRASGRGGGTTLPGRALLRFAPDAIARLGTGLDQGTTIVSATNGKTTTAGMIAAILAVDGRQPVHNRAGSNMTWGVATALLEQRGREGLFEVDEAWLPRVAEQLQPRLIVLGNLFRDQLDRYGEMEALADEWAQAVAAHEGSAAFALNADDPLIADLGRDADERPREGVLYFGIDDASQALPELQHAFDAKHCRRCGHPYAYERAFVGHLGHYSCPNCGAKRPTPDVAATKIELQGMSGSRSTIRTPDGEIQLQLPLPGLYNVYNALAAITAGLRLGVAPQRIAAALGEMRAAFGRVETIAVERRRRLDPADQEPGRRQRGAADPEPGGRAGADRPLARAQRPDRRRARRLLGLGRRLRAARRRGQAGGLRRHPGAGDGAAPQVRRLADRADRGDPRDRALPGPGHFHRIRD